MAERTVDMPIGDKPDPKGGALYFSSSAATTIGGATTPVLAAGTTAACGASKDVTVSVTNRLTYEAREGRIMLAQFAGKLDVAAGADAITAHIFKNGAEVTGASQTVTVTAGTPLQVAISVVLDMDVDDYVEVWVENEDAAANITVTEGILSLIG